MSSPKDIRVGWIGTGVMGKSMCGHLLQAGYPVALYNRSKNKAVDLIERGAVWCDTPSVVGDRSDIVFTMVGFPSDVKQTILGEAGVFSAVKLPQVVVDMTTSEPTLAREIAVAATAKGIASLDAPVSGGDIGAREARLSIMVGGDRKIFEKVKPLFEVMGKTILYQGPPGSGQHCKLTNQILVAGVMVSLCEALLYASRTGGDLEAVLAAVSSGAASSWSLINLGPKILQDDYAPGFYVDHFVKDLTIVLSESQRLGLNLPGLALAKQLYSNLQQEGDGQLGTQALIRSLRRMNAQQNSQNS